MSIFDEQLHRDDMHSLNMDGLNVDRKFVEPRQMGKLDRPHIFQDGEGEIVPASQLRTQNVGSFKSKSLKLGPPHSHSIDEGYRLHLLEEMPNLPRDLLRRFRRQAKALHDLRRSRRDS